MAGQGQEKIIVYDSLTAKICLWLCNMSMPLWGFLAPIVLALGVVAMVLITVFSGGRSISTEAAALSFYLAMIFMIGATLTGLFEDSNLVISEEGLMVPALNSLSNRFERFVPWRQISRVTIEGEDLNNPGSLNLQLATDKGSVTLSLKALVASDIEYLLVSASNWLPTGAIDSRVEQLKEVLWNSASEPGSNLISYTQMWEDELSNRYSATAYMPLSPGQRLQDNRLKVIRQLAFGGWSAIYLVQESNTSLRVLKESVIPPGANKALKIKAQEMFSREAALLLKLNHPGVVKVHDQFIEDSRHYLLLDYISGQNLRQKIKLEGPSHELDVIEYSLQLATIFIYLHNQEPPVVHRDVTPDNIVITADGKIKLIDFGAANELIGTATGTLVGKQSYISPEQFRGHATTSSDLYGFGATIYYLLTGRDPEPLTQSSPKQITASLSADLDQLVQKLTAQSEEERPVSAAAVQERLLALQEQTD